MFLIFIYAHFLERKYQVKLIDAWFEQSIIGLDNGLSPVWTLTLTLTMTIMVDFDGSTGQNSHHGPIVRYVKLWVAHAPGMPGTFLPPPTSKEIASQRPRHASRRVRHARAVMHVGIANPRWRGKRSRHSRCMRNPKFYVSVKRPIATFSFNVLTRSWCPNVGTGHHIRSKRAGMKFDLAGFLKRTKRIFVQKCNEIYPIKLIVNTISSFEIEIFKRIRVDAINMILG